MPSDRGRRLHPLSIPFAIVRGLGGWLVPLGGAVVFTGGATTTMWMAALAGVAAVATAVLRYLTCRYRFTDDELVVDEGIVFRTSRHIPYGRIQNVSLVEGPLHRMLRVADVQIETAGGARPEAILRVLDRPSVEEIRARIAALTSSATAPSDRDPVVADAGRVLVDLPATEALLFGLLSDRGLLVVAAIFGAGWQFGLDDALGNRIDGLFHSSFDVALPGPRRAIVLGVILLAGSLVLLRLLSALWGLVRFGRFRLTRRGEELSIEQGLVTRLSTTVLRRRIQRLTIEQSFLARRLGRVTVVVETAGALPGATDDDDGTGSGRRERIHLAPLLREEELPALLAEAMPEVEIDTFEWKPLSLRAQRRLFRRGLFLSAVVTGGALAALPAARPTVALVGGLLAVLSWISALAATRPVSWALGAEAFADASGWWRRRRSVVRYSKIQSITLSESPGDRRHRMATVSIDTAGVVGRGVEVAYLDRDDAHALATRLRVEAARRRFQW